MGKSEKIIAAVDVGTTKVVVVAGRKNEAGKIEILGYGKARSMGVKRGVVLNIDEAFSAIHEAIRQAEDAFQGDIEEVYVNIVGQQLKTLTNHAERYIGERRIVSEEDVDALFQQVKKIDLPAGYKIYHTSPQLFTIDHEVGVPNPVGMAGEKMQADFKLLVAPEVYEENLKLCFERAGITIRRSMIDPLASSEILLSDDEKEAGVVMLDIGGGATKMAVYHDGVLCYSALIPFGGNVITHDIKEGCTILARQAESLKVQFGEAMGDFAPDDKVVTIPGISGWEPKEISFKSLAFIIQARMEEIIEAFFFQLEKSGYMDKVGAGIVLTGGSALMPNLGQLIKFQTGLDVRKGIPRLKLGGQWKELEDPRNATVLGLLLKALNETEQEPTKEFFLKPKKKKVRSTQPGFFSQMKKEVTRQVTLFFDDEQDTEMF
ncbi:cell division protein FtsA [Sunxiuqinia sp. sy24]|uniref:cell division protein FtsA n=1 Tax=Sunxiuqinia sp. sy24 TaxID=3461495 RepID=UPI00404594D2